MTPAALPQAVHLNPWQQWKYFSQPRETADWLHQRLGNLAPVRFQGQSYALVTTPEGARQVFAVDPNQYLPFWVDSFAGLHGEGSLWVLHGEEHRCERQIFIPALHARVMRSQAETIRTITRQHIEKWQTGQTIRVVDTTLRISQDIIMRVVFGVQDDDLILAGRKILTEVIRSIHPFIFFFPRLQRSWFPLWKKYTIARARFDEWAMRLVMMRRARNDPGEDVLGRLLVASDPHGRPVSDQHICNELFSILAAGHNTTYVGLAWVIYELSRHPEVAAKLREELESAGVVENPEAAFTLPYLSAVCNETLRLHTIVPECARVPTSPVEIIDHTIPAGQALVVSIVGIHHDPELYPEPDEFRPERFIERNYSVYEFLPFGGGHRRCLGAVLGEYELRCAVAEIVLGWDFEPAMKEREIRHNLAMGPKYGVHLRVKRQRHKVQQ